MSATSVHDSPMDATRHAIPNSPRLYPAFELGWIHGKPGFATGLDAEPESITDSRTLLLPSAVWSRPRTST